MKLRTKPAIDFTTYPDGNMTNVYACLGEGKKWIASIHKNKDGFYFSPNFEHGKDLQSSKYYYEFLNSLCRKYASENGAVASKIMG